MAGETIITLVGNLTADPELRFSPSGAAVAIWDFDVALAKKTADELKSQGQVAAVARTVTKVTAKPMPTDCPTSFVMPM